MNVSDVEDRIQVLFKNLRNTTKTSEETASLVNSILLHQDKVSKEIILAAWDNVGRLASSKNVTMSGGLVSE